MTKCLLRLTLLQPISSISTPRCFFSLAASLHFLCSWFHFSGQHIRHCPTLSLIKGGFVISEFVIVVVVIDAEIESLVGPLSYLSVYIGVAFVL